MNDNLFELLGIEPEAMPPSAPTPRPVTKISSLIPPVRPSKLGLHPFLAQRYPARTEQQRPFNPTPLKIDDRRATDRSPNFCAISVTVPIAVSDRFSLQLINPPWNDEVRALVREHHGQWIDQAAQTRIDLNVRLKRHGLVRELAQAIRSVVSIRQINRTGRRYPISDWRWLAGRTADSLDGLANVIWEFRKERAGHRTNIVLAPAPTLHARPRG